MTPKNLLKFIQWYERTVHHATTVRAFFSAAYIHRYGKPDNGTFTNLDKRIIDDALEAWNQRNDLPGFVKQFWKEKIIPTLLRKGGKE